MITYAGVELKGSPPRYSVLSSATLDSFIPLRLIYLLGQM